MPSYADFLALAAVVATAHVAITAYILWRRAMRSL